MDFIKFPKIYERIPNSLKSNSHKITGEWIATEKIHGANFSIYCDGNEVKFGKRTGFLHHTDSFYNYQQLIPSLTPKILELFQLIKLDPANNIDHIIAYGELCGGWFPPDDIRDVWDVSFRIKDERIIVPMEERAVQEGVYYHPNITFITFDIMIVTDQGNIFLDYDEVIKLCTKVSLNYTPILATGKLGDLISMNINFNSTIPAYLGLPHLENNTAEGIVVKKLKNKLVKNDTHTNIRHIIKIKHAKFSEICNLSGFDKHKASKSPKGLLTSMINKNRLDAVISKGFQLNIKNIDQITTELLDDIWTDFYINFNLDIDNFCEINKFLEIECLKFITKQCD